MKLYIISKAQLKHKISLYKKRLWLQLIVPKKTIKYLNTIFFEHEKMNYKKCESGFQKEADNL